MTDLKPIGDHLIVAPDDPERVTEGGIFLPETTRDKIATGRVVAVGSGHLIASGRLPLEVQVGDRVTFLSVAGTDFERRSGSVKEKLLLLSELDLLFRESQNGACQNGAA